MPYRMKDGRWRAEKMIHGRRRSKVCATKAEAKKWEAAQRAEDWGPTPEESPQTVTVFSWAQEYLDYVRTRFVAKTYYHKRAAFARLLRHLPAGMGVRELSEGTVLPFLGERAATRSGHAANVDRKNLRAAWEWGRKHIDGWPEAPNPFAQAEKFAADRTPRYVPPEADFWAVIERGCTRDEDRAFLLLLLFTSARCGEIFRLRWEDIDLVGERIRLSTRKRTGGGMDFDWLPLVRPAADVLDRLPKRGVLVFPDADGGPYAQRQHLMARLCKRAGVRRFGFHAIRHLSASILAQEGVPLPVIQGILRHKSVNTTAIYLRSLGADLPELDRVWKNRGVENALSDERRTLARREDDPG